MIKILGIKISDLNKGQILEKIKEFLTSRQSHYIVTPNPEIILASRDDEELFYILNCADISIADGIGLKFAGFFCGKNLKIITGADLVKDILKIALEEKKKVGIVDWEEGFSKKVEIEDAIEKNYPGLEVMVEKIKRDKNAILPDKFINWKPQILFVTLGYPWQEKFIYHNLKKMPSIRLAMGVGGSFDFLTGKKKRAPKILRSIGMEWFWRLILQPNRIIRIYKAVVYFPYRFLRSKFFCPFFYRPSVACILYKKDKEKYKILILERKDEPGHWQIPQGGTRGEALMKAGERELSEETNCNKFIPKRTYKNIHKYKFGNRPGETSEKAESRRKHTGFKGQKQGLFISEFTGNDSDIKVNFWDHTAWKWVDSEKLIDNVHIIRKRATQRFLKKFEEFIGKK